ncbi:MAG: SAM-dependent methyltransferase [Anaerolinea sp.]|nr:SAM-dependent methyltransferase [Anaerolinea sp.]
MGEHPDRAARYDKKSAAAELSYRARMRERLIGGLRGDILELGAGTGLNFPHYSDRARVVAIEPDPHMRERALMKLRLLAGPNITVEDGHAEHLPFADGSFDAVVATLVLCSVEDIEATLGEVMRVLKPEGELRFMEHIRGTKLRGAIQDLVSPAWGHFGSGCRPNRRTPRALRRAGFRVELIDERRGRAVTAPIVSGIARRSTAPETTPDQP